MKLNDEHTVTRFVRGKDVHIDDDGNPVAIFPKALEMRDIDKGKLSVNWLEYFKSHPAVNLETSVRVFRKQFAKKPPNKLPAGSVFAITKVGLLVSTCAELGHIKTKVDHNGKPRDPNPAHSRIIGLPVNDATVMHKLANEVFVYFVRDCDIPET